MEDALPPPIVGLVPEASAPLVERPTDGLGFRLACQPGDLGGETLDLGVLDVERHDYTMVYRKGVMV
jgi:hypothetical protein